MSKGSGVLIIYTGGTIGSVPSKKSNPSSALVPTKSFIPLLDLVPGYDAKTRTMVLENKEISVHVKDWNEPMDSANLRIEHWYEMAKMIRDHYDEYEGFVILHGTDTLTYSSSALSFILQNLSKPVIFTGSQRPLVRTRSDAIQNLVTSIEIAASKSLRGQTISEVCVFFRDSLMRGNRTTKTSANDYRAFNSPNYAILGKASKRFQLDFKQLSGQVKGKLELLPGLEHKVFSLDLFPGMSMDLFENLLSSPGLRGVVLKTYGAGNAPTLPRFLNALRKASDSGVVILDVTQCWSGEVEMGLYETSSKLLECGVVSGMDMTPEAGLTKLMAVLGSEPDAERARALLQVNLCGEMAGSTFHYHYPAGRLTQQIGKIELDAQEHPSIGKISLRNNRLDRAILRFFGCRNYSEESIFMKISLVDEKLKKLKMIGKMTIDQGHENETIHSVSVPVMSLQFLKNIIKPKLVVESDTSGRDLSWDFVDLSLMTLS